MISIIEWKSRQQFESKKLASEYFKIPITKVNKSIKDKTTVTHNNKQFTFRMSWNQDGNTRMIKPDRRPTLSFGKYKGKKPKNIPLNYLIWVKKNVKPCPYCVKKFLKEKGY